jgi:hypothetical protein
MASPYRKLADLLRADAATVDSAYTAHTVRHGCADGACEARRVLRETVDSLRAMVAREDWDGELFGGLGGRELCGREAGRHTT